MAADAEPEHPRDWRPQVLAFSDDAHRREQLLRFASWIEGGSGLTTAVRILIGEGVKMLKLREEAQDELRKDLTDYGLKAFPLTVVAPNLQVGVQMLVQAFGIGPLRVNTILLNWLGELPRDILGIGEHRYGHNLRVAFRLGSNIIILSAKEEAWETLESLPSQKRRIDVWWRGDATSRLMLLLAYLMKREESWSEAKIRLLVVSEKDRDDRTPEAVKTMLEDARIEATPEVVEQADTDVIARHSTDAALVFLPFRLKGSELIDLTDAPLGETINRVPIVAAVLAAEDIDLGAEPEEGKAGEMAAALDALEDAEKKAKQAEEEAAEAAAEADEKLQNVRDAVISGIDRDKIMNMAAAARKAREQATKAARRAAKALARVDNAAVAVEALGGQPRRAEQGESLSEDLDDLPEKEATSVK